MYLQPMHHEGRKRAQLVIGVERGQLYACSNPQHVAALALRHDGVTYESLEGGGGAGTADH